MAQGNVRVKFVTSFPEYRIPEAPVALPIKLNRVGLSGVVNHFLDQPESSVSFDFLIGDIILRGSLKKFIASHGISTENVLEIEYFPSVSISDDTQSADVPAWVGCLDATHNANSIIAGCYDGQIQLLSHDTLDIVNSCSAHTSPIRSILQFTVNSNDIIASASKDNSIRFWNSSLQSLGGCNGHFNSVESLDFWESRSLLLSGDWSGNIFGWNMSSFAVPSSTEEPVKKKKKTMTDNSNEKSQPVANASENSLSPLFSLKGHSQSISGLHSWNQDRVLTCSWDHSMKLWDMERQDCLTTFVTSKVMTSIHGHSSSNLVLTSHPDARVRCWDPRVESNSENTGHPQLTFITKEAEQDGEISWISQVKWHPSKEHVFGSVDFSGIVRVWDTRSSGPLESSQSHDGKGLCLDWDSQSDSLSRLVSGGSDCAVKSTVVN